jgi:hypothetical protein
VGRTVPPFRIVLAMEKEEWQPLRNALGKSERKEFDEMFDIPRLYIATCSNSVQLYHPYNIVMFILLHHYKQLKECTAHLLPTVIHDIQVSSNAFLL